MYDYYQWLIKKVECRTAENYTYLLQDLHSMPFKYMIPEDEHRALDGIELRYDYLREENMPIEEDKDYRECSILEMMIALSERFSYEVVGKQFAGLEYWFWKMLSNLGLLKYSDATYDEKEVENIVEKFVYRTYEKNGDGGIFPLFLPKKDQRKVEIWYQLFEWYMENYT